MDIHQCNTSFSVHIGHRHNLLDYQDYELLKWINTHNSFCEKNMLIRYTDNDTVKKVGIKADRAIGQSHVPAAFLSRITWYTLYRKLGRSQCLFSWVLNISPPPGFDPRTVLPLASHYIAWAIEDHNEMFRDIIINKNIHTYSENCLERTFAIQETLLWRTAYISHEDTNFRFLY